jgi:hypothetical protein
LSRFHVTEASVICLLLSTCAICLCVPCPAKPTVVLFADSHDYDRQEKEHQCNQRLLLRYLNLPRQPSRFSSTLPIPLVDSRLNNPSGSGQRLQLRMALETASALAAALRDHDTKHSLARFSKIIFSLFMTWHGRTLRHTILTSLRIVRHL